MEVFEKINEILRDLSGKEEINPEDELEKDLSLDSLNMVMLLLEIEDMFDITLDEADMNPFDLHTVQDVMNLVARYQEDANE